MKPEKKPEAKTDDTSELSSDLGLATSDADDAVISESQKLLEEKDKKRLEERFLWVLVFVIYIDIQFFIQMENWSAPLVIMVFQAIGLIVFADRCEIGTVRQLFAQITKSVHNVVLRKD